MSKAYEIPLSAKPQKFSIALAGVMYQINLRWNHMSSLWSVDLSDADGNLLIGNLPLVTGANLLEQYDFLALGGALYVKTDGDATALPSFDGIGTNSHLYFVVS